MVEVKICGLSTRESIDAAIEAGAAYIGLVFFPGSPRNVSLEQARDLAAHARGRAKIVALVVDADDAALQEISEAATPDLFQLHGSETPERTARIATLSKRPVIKVIKVGEAADTAQAINFADTASFILFDAKAPASLLPGGNGMALDWSLLNGVTPKSFMLAGGLDAFNVRQAIEATGAAMVDVSSGVESSPGVKDLTLIRKFIEAAKSAS